MSMPDIQSITPPDGAEVLPSGGSGGIVSPPTIPTPSICGNMSVLPFRIESANSDSLHGMYDQVAGGFTFNASKDDTESPKSQLPPGQYCAMQPSLTYKTDMNDGSIQIDNTTFKCENNSTLIWTKVSNPSPLDPGFNTSPMWTVQKVLAMKGNPTIYDDKSGYTITLTNDNSTLTYGGIRRDTNNLSKLEPLGTADTTYVQPKCAVKIT